MAINVKKYTKEQMEKMVEDTQEKTAALEAEITELKNCIDAKNDLIAEYANLKAAMQRKNVALTEQISQMNGEAINKANEIANLKADADALRNKLADTEAALTRGGAPVNSPCIEHDNVNHPAHYTAGGVECIDAIAAALTCQKDPMQAWLTGQVLKYMWRWPLKNGKEDLRKARFYLDRLINSAGDD
jgi:hypothetical protein